MSTPSGTSPRRASEARSAPGKAGAIFSDLSTRSRILLLIFSSALPILVLATFVALEQREAAEARARADGGQGFSLKLSIRVAGPDGRDFKQADRDLTFDVSGAELESARRDGVLSTFAFEGEKPGFYRISVAVRDNYSGKIGNSRVFYEVSKKDLNKSSGGN